MGSDIEIDTSATSSPDCIGRVYALHRRSSSGVVESASPGGADRFAAAATRLEIIARLCAAPVHRTIPPAIDINLRFNKLIRYISGGCVRACVQRLLVDDAIMKCVMTRQPGSIDSCVNNVLSRHTIGRKLHRKEGSTDDGAIWLARSIAIL